MASPGDLGLFDRTSHQDLGPPRLRRTAPLTPLGKWHWRDTCGKREGLGNEPPHSFL